MNNGKKHLPGLSVQGRLLVISHVFYMSGKDSKYFFVELQRNNISDTDQGNICTILARVKNLDKSMLDLQKNRMSSESLIGKRYILVLV